MCASFARALKRKAMCCGSLAMRGSGAGAGAALPRKREGATGSQAGMRARAVSRRKREVDWMTSGRAKKTCGAARDAETGGLVSER